MRSTIALAVLTLAPAAVASAGVEVGVRTGIAVPAGGVGGTPRLDLGDLFSAGVPLWGELAYRLDDYVSLGAFGSYSVLFAKNCPSATSCSGHDVRAGVDLQLHPIGAAVIEPWVAVGFGYEWLTYSESSGGLSADLGVRGFEFASVEVGVDFAVATRIRVGPFATLALGQYEHVDVSGSVNASSSIANQTLHEWVMLGIRAMLRL
jgi:hypothetical protein